MTSVPAGPWVLVIGCHRSGTSAATGALVALGLHGVDPADRMDRLASNPEHWESLTAALFDEDLLARAGGTWDAPPVLDGGIQSPDPASGGDGPATFLAAAYPEPGPVVWKDPRACLLLPYWRSVLPGPLAAVFVWRDPLAVARSLHTRDGIPLAEGLALWEHYNRAAATGLQGIDTYVLDYASLVEDPAAALGPLAGWLGGLAQLAPSAGEWDLDAAVASVDGGLRHESADEATGGGPLPRDHRVVADWLAASAGGHRPLDTLPPGTASPWYPVVFAGRRRLASARTELAALEAEYAQVKATLEHLLANREAKLSAARQELEGERLRYDGVRRELDRVTASTSWRITAPLRSVMARVSRLR